MLLGVFIMVLLGTASPWLGTLHFYFGCHGSGPDVAVLVLAELLAIVYVPLTWMSSFGRTQRGVLLIPPACMVLNAVPMLFELHGSALETAQLHIIVGLVPFVPAVVRAPRQVMLMITGLLMLGPAIIGARMTLDALMGLNAGHHWSDWPDPRLGQIHDQYPLTNDEALLAGIGLTLAAAPLAILWVWVAGAFARRR